MVDMTNLTNITGLGSLAKFTNNSTDGVLFTGGLIVFFIIILVGLFKNGEPFENALVVSSWSMFIVSILFWYGELVPPLVPLGFLVTAAVSVLILKTSQY